MDKLAGLIANIELAIRYLLSGLAIYAIYLLRLANTSSHIEWIGKQPLFAILLTAAIGFSVYSIYRIVFWVVGDGIAWLLGLSAPEREPKTEFLYHKAYARFLLWRRKDNFDGALNGYLHYRWAVVHFTFIVALALVFALANREANSIIDKWYSYAVALTGICLVAAVWQCSFLFRVERELYRSRQK